MAPNPEGWEYDDFIDLCGCSSFVPKGQRHLSSLLVVGSKAGLTYLGDRAVLKP